MNRNSMHLTQKSCAFTRSVYAFMAVAMMVIFVSEMVYWIGHGLSMRVIAQMPLEFVAILMIPVAVLYLGMGSRRYGNYLRYMRKTGASSLTQAEMRSVSHRFQK